MTPGSPRPPKPSLPSTIDRSPLRTPPAASSAATRASMVGNRRSDTQPELALRRELHRRGRRFRVDHPVRVPGLRLMRVDIAFPRQRLLVFVDGCFWHSCPEHRTSPRANGAYWQTKLAVNAERDLRQTAALEADGWRVLRVWEHVSPVDAADLVEQALQP
jgi:DNA mismatch endonuclease (patch repair protein)